EPRASPMRRPPPSATARWERSRAGSIVRASGCQNSSPSTARTITARIIPRAGFCRPAGAAKHPWRGNTHASVSLKLPSPRLCDAHAWWVVVCEYRKSTTLADLWERAAIGPIPGSLVVVAGVLFHGAWAVLALVTYRIEIASRRERRSLIAMG